MSFFKLIKKLKTKVESVLFLFYLAVILFLLIGLNSWWLPTRPAQLLKLFQITLIIIFTYYLTSTIKLVYQKLTAKERKPFWGEKEYSLIRDIWTSLDFLYNFPRGSDCWPAFMLFLGVHFLLILPSIVIRLFFLLYWARWFYIYLSEPELKEFKIYHSRYSDDDYSSFYLWYYFKFGFISSRLFKDKCNHAPMTLGRMTNLNSFLHYFYARYMWYIKCRTFLLVLRLVKLFRRHEEDKVIEDQGKFEAAWSTLKTIVILIVNLIIWFLTGLPFTILNEFRIASCQARFSNEGVWDKNNPTPYRWRLRRAAGYIENKLHDETRELSIYKTKESIWNFGKPKTLEDLLGPKYKNFEKNMYKQ